MFSSSSVVDIGNELSGVTECAPYDTGQVHSYGALHVCNMTCSAVGRALDLYLPAEKEEQDDEKESPSSSITDRIGPHLIEHPPETCMHAPPHQPCDTGDRLP